MANDKNNVAKNNDMAAVPKGYEHILEMDIPKGFDMEAYEKKLMEGLMKVYNMSSKERKRQHAILKVRH
jgi:uncharacterized membrane protein